MTSVERGFALWGAIEHVERHGVAGDVVECGVWRGGSAMLASLALKHFGNSTRRLWLYDTFAGMPHPGPEDVDHNGVAVRERWGRHQGRREDAYFAFGSLAQVRENMARTEYPPGLIRYVQGPVEQTLASFDGAQISLLRLDTDWYSSTKVELEVLWPRLSPNGVLIVDDYGHWQGARRAVDEFFAERDDAPLLTRIDYTGRIAVKS